MNGHLTASSIARVLSRKASNFDEINRDATFTVNEIRDFVANLSSELIEMANVNLEVVAREIVAGCPNQKIHAIKELRDRTGVSLRDAKLAVEVAMYEQAVIDANLRAHEALAALDAANRMVPYSKRAVIHVNRYNNALTTSGMITDEPPF